MNFTAPRIIHLGLVKETKGLLRKWKNAVQFNVVSCKALFVHSRGAVCFSTVILHAIWDFFKYRTLSERVYCWR